MREELLTAPKKRWKRGPGHGASPPHAVRTAAGVTLPSIARERNARHDDLCDLSPPDSYVSCDLPSATCCLKTLLRMNFQMLVIANFSFS